MRDVVLWIVSIACVVVGVASSVSDVAVHWRQGASNVRRDPGSLAALRRPDAARST